jgi:hypothetical protein
MSNPEAPILQLPDELLLDIAKDVDVTGLHGLSLTSRRMRPVAQECLFRKATLSPINVWKLVGTLQSRPGLAMALTHLRFGPITQVQRIDMMRISELHEMQSDHSLCCDIIPQLYPQKDEAAKEHTQARVDDFYSAGVIIIVALAKGMETISTGTVAFNAIPVMKTLFHDQSTVTSCWHEQARSQLEGRLEGLNIVVDPRLESYVSGRRMSAGDPFPCFYIDFSRFELLKRIVIPYTEIGKVSNHLARAPHQPNYSSDWKDPGSMLPYSLESITLTQVEAFFDVDWFSKLLGCVNLLPNLRKIKMRISYNILSTAWYIRASPQGGRKFLALLRSLEGSNALLTMAFGEVKFAEVGTGMMFPTSNDYISGDLAPALEKCLATTHDNLEKDAEMLAALGYTARSTG